MKGIGRFLTALALLAALLLGAVGGVSAHALMDQPDAGAAHQETPCPGHDDDHAVPCDSPAPDRHQIMPMTAPCCPTLGAPVRVEAAPTMAEMPRTTWHPVADARLDARRITPEPRPPKLAR